ncbi:MAG: DUF6765 family protein [Nitrospirota bacterium]
MDIEFHYYITYIIALRAGFRHDDAHIIAYSSQYVDDNNTIYEISDDNGNIYQNYISQTMNILKPKKELMRIYPIFHFMPGITEDITGDSSRRCDGKLHLLNTIPDNQNAQRLLQTAFDSNDPYRIGIATHMYSDTFAHQNFVGYYDAFNSMAGLLEAASPDIGHADAKHSPDWPALKWKDERLIPSHSEIDNKKRFIEAAGFLFDRYCSFTGSKAQDRGSLMAELDKAIGEYNEMNEQRDIRIDRYKTIIGEGFIDYDADAWFKEAVSKRIGFFKWNYKSKENFQESRWFKFHEAVKAHQKEAKDVVLKPVFDSMELKNL